MAKVRSEYIKKLMTEQANLADKLKEVAQKTVESILEEKTKDNLKQILSEDENSFSEEEVENDVDAVIDDNEADAATEEDAAQESDGEGAEEGAEANEDDKWAEWEQYKDENGEYDLRGMGNEEVIEILKSMNAEDSVRIFKDEEGEVTIEDENGDATFKADIDNENAEDGSTLGDEDAETDGESDGDIEFEIETEEGEGDGEEDDDDIEFDFEELDEDLGYTDNYQDETAMTVDSNNEPADKGATYSMDGGVPQGTEKPFAGKGDDAPFDNKVNECGDAECGAEGCEGEDVNEVVGGKARQHGSGKDILPNSEGNSGAPEVTRHKSVAGEYKEKLEEMKKRMNAILRENKELKENILPKLVKQIKESIVVNQSLANVIRLVNENSTTKQEKQNILARFNECKTREESNKLFQVISEELKRDNKRHEDVEATLNGQLTESRHQTAVETTMYQSEDLSNTLSFMERLNAVR